jgi:hypothetical protein
MQNNIDITKIVLDIFKNEFPGAPEAEVQGLIDDIGQTIMAESTAKMVDEVEERQKEDEKYAEEIKEIFSKESVASAEDIKRISEICMLPHINIDMEKIYQEVATDVVKDVLGK